MARQPWPAGLPQDVSKEGYGESPPDTLLRTSFDAGPVKQRSRTSSAATPVEATMDMTLEELQMFDEFFSQTLVNGSLSFDWIHPRTKAPAVLRFTGVPKYAAKTGVHFKVDLSLEILNGS